MTIAPQQGQAVETVTLTIDGVEATVPKGTLVIRAAEQLGIAIPRFCDHPLLDPAGACRQCLVEVEGQRKPLASCTTTCTEGMVVKTQLSSPVAKKAQEGIMEFLLINHPLDCPICDKGGECPLQNQAMSAGRPDSRFVEQKREYPKPLAISTQVLLDRERCVLCQRCTRFSEEIAGDPFIDLMERGAAEQIGVYSDSPYVGVAGGDRDGIADGALNSEGDPFNSYFSGNTIQICPVGALTSSDYRFRSRPFDLVSSPAINEHDSSGDAIRVDHRRGKVTRRLSGEDAAVNEEWISDKARFAFRYATAHDRLTYPLVREDGELRQASWTEALAKAAEGLAAARDAGGVGVLTGGRLTVEDAYAYAKFARVALRTNDIDFRVRPHSAEEAAFLADYAAGVSPNNGGVTYTDVEHAPVVLLAGLEPEEEAPSVFLRLRKGFRKHGLRLFSVQPFETPAVAKTGGTLIQAAPGTEAEILSALAGDAPVGVAEIEAARQAVRTAGAVVLVGERLAAVPGGLSAAALLADVTGARLAWVPRRAGDRGAVDAGCLPTLLPGARPVTDLSGRVQLASYWGVESLPSTPGRDTAEILVAAATGQLAGLVVGGVDPGDLPDPDAAEQALDAVGFLVSLELRDSWVTRHADVVLPVAPAVEKSGSFLNWEGRLRIFETVLSTGAMTDARVLDAIAAELGIALGTGDPRRIRAELAGLPAHEVRPTPPNHLPAEPPTPGAGQAVLASWHHLLDLGSLQDEADYLAGTARAAVVRLSATTAAEIGAADGAPVTVSTGRGAITLPLRITDMPDRVVWLPTNSAGSTVRRTLGTDAGAVVAIAADGGGTSGPLLAQQTKEEDQ
ncbi:NADH-quinone oxidoreductase subunit G [Actinocatenispora rupis]|uniref:NADH-quinone oxidoreductase subunit G n=1 Tax=Actinocatenispora rupis TaxID=519421 RepID=A0A8J3NE44_9ACTN|nr:NADH-quinone oxidoreductase subunit G [Actinocatenispora rupis]GID15651.1 NADH-quinone oxidoreductase subunit G [Actinocatenispora rupis]